MQWLVAPQRIANGTLGCRGTPVENHWITRWATWVKAALFYSENLPAVRTIVNNRTGEGLLVSRAKEVINEDGLVPDLVCINQYQTLETNVEQY